ncbi:P-loop containing nucleoside triphosphate hydrolase protein [Thozetella sp. PMI_491]|nr:P-loop containing nucleoside triphosphate hydrolase protein [Thozetella sp. PMI_491]
MAAVSGGCPANADDQFGPRVDTACRSFDFTLLFEDAFFGMLPAALFLLMLPIRLRGLRKASVKVMSYRLAVWKLSLLAALFVLHLINLAFGLQTSGVHSRLVLPAGLLNAAAILAATAQSFMEDQKSLNPSDMLVIYFSLSTILAIPRLRSLWLIPSELSQKLLGQRVIWTILFALTVLIVLVESAAKNKWLRPAYRNATAEQTIGFWGKSFYIWLLPLFQNGYSKLLQLDDIPNVDSDLEEKSTWGDLDARWNRLRGRHRLLRAALAANKRTLLSAVLARVVLAALTFTQPFLIGAAVSYLNDDVALDNVTQAYGQALVGAFLVVYLGLAVVRALYWRQAYRMIARVRSGLTAAIYRQTLTLRSSDGNGSAAVTLMGTDVERIVDALTQIHELWASALEIAVATYLLAREISYAALVPLVVCIGAVVGAAQVAKRFGTAQRVWNERVEDRISATIHMLSDMKAVKMLGLSTIMSDMITKMRQIELEASEKFRVLRIWRILISNAPTTIAPFVTFAAYAGIAVARQDSALFSAQAFTSLTLVNLLTHPLLNFCATLPTFFQAVSCFGRVEEYLITSPPSEPLYEIPSVRESSQESGTELRGHPSSSHSNEPLISFDHADIAWSRDAIDPTLRDLSLTIGRGITAITGPVACGKSTLLASIIGDTTLKSGSVTPPALSGVAFCSQTPWLTNDTIRENITGGLTFDQKWYNHSLACSCLEDDLARMPQGDQSMAGSNGSSLSGGQRQRVALARAVYSRLPIVIFDDVVSGLDSKTLGVVITRLFGNDGHFRKAGVSVIIATHNQRVLPHADRVVVFDEGRLVGQGPYGNMRAQHPRFFRENDSDEQAQPQETKADDQSESDMALVPQSTGAASTIIQSPVAHGQYKSWELYDYYLRSAGIITVFLWIFFTLGEAVTINFTTIWVDIWTEANEKNPNQQLGLYLGVYTVLVVVAVISIFAQCWYFFIDVITNTAFKMHADLLKTTISAQFSVFQQKDTGSITNRFSQDMDLIDMRLPTNAIMFTSAAASCIVQLIMICVLGKYLAAVIPVLTGALFIVQRYYLRTSQQVRLIDIEAKAPLYKHFVETVRGVSTIRAFRWQAILHKRHAVILDRAQRPFYMLFCIQQWLQLTLDLIVAALAVVIVAIATSSARTLNAGALGAALVLVLQFNSLLIQSIQAWTQLETSIGAVARVKHFIDETPLEAPGTQLPSPDWPVRGAVCLQGVVAHYPSQSRPALDNVSLTFAPGEKTAVCGPSGSGKTSLITSILRMMNVNTGTITIDDADILSLDVDDLRSSISVIPQDPFFIPGTVRFNLDPQGRSSDTQIESALRMVRLWGRLVANAQPSGGEGGLDSKLVASEWSQGEKQLLCLARALLVRSKVVILDEATSSVDDHTEAIMQDIIDTEFRDCTVISVLHRFTYIDHFDKVAVLKAGKLVECDSPQALLGRDSAFRELYRAHRDIKPAVRDST